MKAKEIREMGIGELEKLVEGERAKAAQLRFDIVAKQAKGHRAYRKARRTVAQGLTILAEKKGQ